MVDLFFKTVFNIYKLAVTLQAADDAFSLPHLIN